MDTNYLDKWRQYMMHSKDLSRNTVESYMSDMNLLLNFLAKYNNCAAEEVNLFCINKLVVRAWFLSRMKDGNNAKSIARGLSAIKSYLGFLHKNGIFNDDHTFIMSMKPPKIQKTLPRPIKIEDIHKIIDAIQYFRKDSWVIKRDRSILTLIYSVGLRISEALSLNCDDLCGDKLKIYGKGGKIRYVPLLDCVKDNIQMYMSERPMCAKHSNALFVNKNGGRVSPGAIESIVKKVREYNMLSNNITPHAFRHSCATHLIEHGADLRHVQELLGHSSISSTQIYADVTNAYMCKVYDQCHPLSQQSSCSAKLSVTTKEQDDNK